MGILENILLTSKDTSLEFIGAVADFRCSDKASEFFTEYLGANLVNCLKSVLSFIAKSLATLLMYDTTGLMG